MDDDDDDENKPLQECQGPILECDEEELDTPEQDKEASPPMQENEGGTTAEQETQGNEGAAHEDAPTESEENQETDATEPPDPEDQPSVAPQDIDSSINTSNIISGSRTCTRDAPLSVSSTKGQTHAAKLLSEVHDSVALPATAANLDTMTLHQASNKPDAEEFLKAMEKEVKDHEDRKHWKLVTREQMTRSGHKGKPIMAVWSMK